MTRANRWTDPERWFWPNVDQSGGPGACHPWTRPPHHTGYGVVMVEGRQYRAHVVAFRLVHGVPDQDVLHRCGTRLCCNGAHLYDGDDKVNAADRERHGRTAHNSGERNGQAKLTEVEVLALLADTRDRHALAAAYGLTPQSVDRIRRGDRWGHLQSR